MKNLFQIQTESGQLWLDIKAQLDAKEAELSAQKKLTDSAQSAYAELKAQVDATLAKVAAAHAAGDADALLTIAAEVAKPAQQKALEAAQAEYAAAAARLADVQEAAGA